MNEFVNAADLPDESPFAPLQTPRLSILHLMLWTFCSAVYLSLMRAVQALQGDLPGGLDALRSASSVLSGIFTGAVLMGAIVLVRTRVRSGPPMLRQPGHWLLCGLAILNLIYLPVMFLQVELQHTSIYGRSPWILYSAIYMAPAIAYILAACHNGVLRWRIIFAGLALVSLAQALMFLLVAFDSTGSSRWFMIFWAIPSWGSVLLMVAIVASSIADLVTRRGYDWLHWTGVTTQVAASSITLLWIVGRWFF